MAIKIISKNKKAHYDFFLEKKYEAGLVLTGTEVKTLRLGKVAMKEAYVTVDENLEAFIYNMTIPQYEFGNINNHVETRKRKLLLNKEELKYIHHQMKAASKTIVPTMIYFKKGLIKLEIALAKGKKKFDKRETEKKRDIDSKLRRGIFD